MKSQWGYNGQQKGVVYVFLFFGSELGLSLLSLRGSRKLLHKKFKTYTFGSFRLEESSDMLAICTLLVSGMLYGS